jgi:hypothetical protein
VIPVPEKQLTLCRKTEAAAQILSLGMIRPSQSDSRRRGEGREGSYYSAHHHAHPHSQGPPRLAIDYTPRQPGASSLVTEVDQISRPWSSTELQRTESSSLSAVMSRIHYSLCKARTDFPSTHFDKEIPHPSPSGIEMALIDLIRAYGSTYRGYYSLEDALATKKVEYESLQARHRSLEDKVLSLEKEIEKEGIKISLLREEQATREQRVTVDHRVELQELKKSNEDEIASIRSRFEKEMMRMKNYFEGEIRHLQQSHRDTIESYDVGRGKMSEQHEREKAVLRRQIEDATTDFHRQLDSIQNKNTEEMKKKSKEIEEILKNHEAEKEKMRKLHDNEKMQLELKREQENRELRNDVEALKGALVKRDHFRALSDRELSYRFQDIASEVEDFARVGWDKRWETDWPFPDTVFSNSKNERKAKKHIVQNAIWVILYEKIFCTPFRVLGNEGKALEREWIEMYGQGKSLYPI